MYHKINMQAATVGTMYTFMSKRICGWDRCDQLSQMQSCRNELIGWNKDVIS